jgi:hypothetical protein
MAVSFNWPKIPRLFWSGKGIPTVASNSKSKITIAVPLGWVEEKNLTIAVEQPVIKIRKNSWL